MLDRDLAESLLDYNADDGTFIWTNYNKNNTKKGMNAGYINKRGYLKIQIFGKIYFAHRLAWLIYYGNFPEYGIDHIDGNKLNNSIKNLRDVGQLDNSKNTKLNKNNKSGFNGVTWAKHRGKWRSRIMFEGKDMTLGFFDDLEEAIRVRIDANKRYGFHDNHGAR
tara:strand:+ start:426 stop:920 length:495 start_codon:yes stop_codon:yes gene_type:complete